jgi:hypothetical protein
VRGALAVEAGILGISVLVMVRGLSTPIDGEHYWRQTHVAANIERYVADGPSLRPSTYNRDAPLLVFDFPAYQLATSQICRIFGTDPLITARLFNIALFIATFIILDRFMLWTGFGSLHRVLCLFFFAAAPLNLFYFRAPMVDPLALCLAFLSLTAFVRWNGGGGGGSYLLMVAAGILSTLVKNPVYLPFALAIAFSAFSRRGPRAFLRGGLILYFVLIAAAVVAFKLYSNRVNEIPAFVTSEEANQYFGILHERLKLKFWAPILATLVIRGGGLLVFVLGLLGGLAYTLRAKGRNIHLGVGLGALLTLLLFFDKYSAHSYYCLPLVFPLAFFAAYATDALFSYLLKRGPIAAWTMIASLLALSLFSSWSGLSAMSAPSTAEMVQAGEWIRLRTHRGDFVFYVLADESPDWLPALLYFAKREGYNLPYPDLEKLPVLEVPFAGRYERFLVFCPGSMLPWLRDELNPLGTLLAETGSVGALYALEPPKKKTP